MERGWLGALSGSGRDGEIDSRNCGTPGPIPERGFRSAGRGKWPQIYELNVHVQS